MQDIFLDFNKSPEESAAAFFAILACPESLQDEDGMGNLHASLSHLAYSRRAATDEKWALQPQLIKSRYAFRDKKQINRDL